MTDLTWQARIDNYRKETKFPVSMGIGEDHRVFGMWVMGNDYKVASGYHGGYPPSYLKRVKALFPDKKHVLHLFSGMVDQSVLPGDTVDINPDLKPTFVDDAQTLSMVTLDLYDLVLCDPPYNVEDAEHYKTSMISRKRVMDALEGCARGTHLVVLDQILWMYRKNIWQLEAQIGMSKSTNHRFRVISIWKRL